MESEWWQTFFSGNWLSVQRTLRADRTQEEVTFLERVLDLRKGNEVLDVPCGNGRLGIPLAERGYRVTGVDITDVLVDEAKAASKHVDFDIVKSDMRNLPWSQMFDAALCFWGSFGYFDDTGNREFLTATNHTLKPGAKFVLDIPNIAETILPRLQSRTQSTIGETLVTEEHSYKYEQSRFEIRWTLEEGGVSETKTSSMRVYGFREVCELFNDTGFDVCEVLSSLQGDPYELGRRGYFVLRKR